jgi:hypothetical protein
MNRIEKTGTWGTACDEEREEKRMPRWRKAKEEEPKRLLDNSTFMHALMERMYFFAARLIKKCR